MKLFIEIDPVKDHYWKNHPTYSKAKKNEDVGLDIPMQESIIVPAYVKSFQINLQFKAKPSHGYMLVPRSSISKTSIRLANSIGIIDKNTYSTLKDFVWNTNKFGFNPIFMEYNEYKILYKKNYPNVKYMINPNL